MSKKTTKKSDEILKQLMDNAKRDHPDLLADINDNVVATLLAEGFTAGANYFRASLESVELDVSDKH